MSPEDRIHRLLDEAVDDVEPRYGLDRIRARTARRPRRGWVWTAAGAALATAATVAAVVALDDDPGTTVAGPGPAASSSSSAQRDQVVYFVEDTGVGPRLVPEVRPVRSAGTALDEAVDDAVTGPATDPDYGTAWPPGSSLQRAQLEGGVLSVDLSGPVVERPAGMTPAAASLAVQQLVWTAQASARVKEPVTFLVDGRPTDVLLGTSTTRPVPAAAADDVLAPVSVTAPGEGATVSSPFTVEGAASAFEATVLWELTGPDGVVKRGYATAEECCTVSPYSFEVTAPPGEYTLVVHDQDVSGGEGNPESEDTKRVTVR
jgi:hypothetical protein